MIQKYKVISGTLLSIWRASEGLGESKVVVVMRTMMRGAAWRFPERAAAPSGSERGQRPRQPELEACSARTLHGNDLSTARPRETPGERQTQARAAA